MMKKIGFLMLAAILLTGSLLSGNAIAQVNEPAPQDKKVTPTEVYYFHMTRRCATCQAVESVTEAAVKEYFADALQKGVVTFKSVNLEEKANKSLVKKMKISGQALLVINGDERIDLTSKGFLYAKNEPDKLKAELKETVGKFVK